jgi:hypothetical protein
MIEKPCVTILDFSEATGFEKGQGQGARFTNLEMHPVSHSGLPGGQGDAIGAHHMFSIVGRVVHANFGLRPPFASNFDPLPRV